MISTAESRALLLLVLFTAVSLLGFGLFGRNPGLLARWPAVAGLYAPAFTFFARGHILIAFSVLGFLLWNRVRFEWIPALFVVGALSLVAELLGTTTGVPFGAYHYTELLGPRVAGRVPLLIPASWFVMALPSYAIGRQLVRGHWPRWFVGAGMLTTWDLTLDPAMSSLTPYWVWDVPGGFYGMPIVNLLGWFATGVVIMIGLEYSGARLVTDRVPIRVMWAYYAVVLSLSVGMALIGGYWLSLGATAAALVGVFGAARALTRGALEPTAALDAGGSR